MKAIINCKLILPHQVLENHHILFEDKILDISSTGELNKEWEILDAKGAFVSPGFINMHIHGAMGSDTMDGTKEALENMAKALPSTGTTSFLPTTMTYDFPSIYKALDVIKLAQKENIGARILGVNLEGPFISNTYKGAQKEENISEADFTKIEAYKDLIKLITIAPETLKDETFIRSCVEAGIIVSLGHSAATYEEAIGALAQGATHFTHLFNAMTPLHHRKPGMVGAALDSDAHVELICDNIHVHPALQRLVYKTKALDKILLITDSIRAALLGDGPSELGGQKVFVKDGKATLEDGTIAGSVLTMNKALANFKENTNAPLWEVVNMASLNPARELGLETTLGSLAVGKLADLTIFDPSFNIKHTFIRGQQTF